MNDFLPEGTTIEEPQSKYMKLKTGINRIRILGSAVVGRQGWKTVEGKRQPVTKRMDQEFGMNEIDDPEEIKVIWSMPIWDYAEKKVKVYKIPQRSIRERIFELTKDEEWGNPVLRYDIKIEKTGEELSTKYSVTPVPPSPTTNEILEAWNEVMDKGFDLNEVFTNGDEFSPKK